MEDKFFKIGAVNYPLVVDSSLPVNAIDPVLARIIDVFPGLINFNCQARWNQEVLKAGKQDKYLHPVMQALPYDPMALNKTDSWTFPLFCAFPISSVYEKDGIHLFHVRRQIQIIYAIEPLESNQAEYLYPFLKAVESILTHRLLSGVDQNEQPLWAGTGVQKVALVSGQFGGLPQLVSNLFFPSYSLVIEILEQHGPGEGNFEEFDGADVSIDEVTNDGPTILDFIQVKT